jgi:hypothetical protein
MADSSVTITAGVGTDIDTRTETTNSNHRQVIVIGDPATNTGVAPVDGTAGVKVNLGADNDVTMATLPDTSGGDLAALGGAVSGTEVQVDVVAALPAGANAIGKLAANSGVDIGDVDVTTTPIDDALAGPAAITTVDSMTSAVVDLAAGTIDQSIVAAPGANKQIWVYGLVLKTNGTTATVVLQNSADVAITGTITLTDSDGFVLPMPGNFEMPWFKVPTNTALEVDTGGSGTVDGIVSYSVVDVT